MNTTTTPRAKAPKVDKSLSERRALRMFDDVMKCKPVMTREDAFAIDRRMIGNGNAAVARRIGLAMASAGGDWFKKVSEDRETAVMVAGQLEAVESCAAMMRELADAMDAGAARALIALCAHEDLQQIKADGKDAAVVSLPAETASGAGAAA